MRGRRELWSGGVAGGSKIVGFCYVSRKGETGAEALLTHPSPPLHASEWEERAGWFAEEDQCCPKSAMEEGAWELKKPWPLPPCGSLPSRQGGVKSSRAVSHAVSTVLCSPQRATWLQLPGLDRTARRWAPPSRSTAPWAGQAPRSGAQLQFVCFG